MGGASSTRRRRLAHQLPAGRHGLSRDVVEANQRERLLDAVIEVASLAGYQAMSVEAICAASGISRRTFYGLFTDKQDAFLAAYDQIAGTLVERVMAAARGGGTFASGVTAAVRACLEFLASDPSRADVCVVEVLAAGPAALERRTALMGAFAAMLERGAQGAASGAGPPELTAETLVGGIHELIFSRVLQGNTDQLPALLPDLVYSILLPWVGHRAASEACEGAGAENELPLARAAGLG